MPVVSNGKGSAGSLRLAPCPLTDSFALLAPPSRSRIKRMPSWPPALSSYANPDCRARHAVALGGTSPLNSNAGLPLVSRNTHSRYAVETVGSPKSVLLVAAPLPQVQSNVSCASLALFLYPKCDFAAARHPVRRSGATPGSAYVTVTTA